MSRSQVFPCEFCKLSHNSFLNEQLRATASVWNFLSLHVEAATEGGLQKNFSLKNLQNLQENTCAGVSFFKNLQAQPLFYGAPPSDCFCHYVKSVQIRSFFWSVFGHFSRSMYMPLDRRNMRI